MWKLTGDFNRDTEDPCTTHQPSGMTVPIIWDNDLPHVYEKHLEDLRVAYRLASVDMKKVATARLDLCLRGLRKVHELKTGKLQDYVAARVTECELEARRRGGRLKFMPECQECREWGNSTTGPSTSARRGQTRRRALHRSLWTPRAGAPTH